MARIVHRRTLPSLAERPPGLRRLPPLGRLFALLAAVVAAVELWPAVSNALLGVTDVAGELAAVLPSTFRNAALVALPAAVLWPRPRAPRTNPWLWKGALIVATVQLARYPAGFVQSRMLEAVDPSAIGEDPLFLAANAIALTLAFLSALGVWAMSEGLKDAGARAPRSAVALVAVAVGALVVAVFGGPVMAEVGGGMSAQLALGLVSIVANAVFLFALGLLAVRGGSGAVRRLEPPRAWSLGGIASIALVASPVLSLSLSLVQQLDRQVDLSAFTTVLRVMAFFGWPLMAVALAMGMGAWRTQPVRAGAPRGARLRVAPRYVPVAG